MRASTKPGLAPGLPRLPPARRQGLSGVGPERKGPMDPGKECRSGTQSAARAPPPRDSSPGAAGARSHAAPGAGHRAAARRGERRRGTEDEAVPRGVPGAVPGAGGGLCRRSRPGPGPSAPAAAPAVRRCATPGTGPLRAPGGTGAQPPPRRQGRVTAARRAGGTAGTRVRRLLNRGLCLAGQWRNQLVQVRDAGHQLVFCR